MYKMVSALDFTLTHKPRLPDES